MTEQTITCVYCGHAFPSDTPTHGATVLTDHIRTCDKHPLRDAESTIAKLRAALVGLIGESDPESLRAMEKAVRLTPGINADKIVALNAIHALLETAQ